MKVEAGGNSDTQNGINRRLLRQLKGSQITTLLSALLMFVIIITAIVAAVSLRRYEIERWSKQMSSNICLLSKMILFLLCILRRFFSNTVHTWKWRLAVPMGCKSFRISAFLWLLPILICLA